MRGNLGDKIRLNHILEAILEIESYLNEVDFETFMGNSMMRFACIKQMEIVGEASNHISEDVKNKFSEIEWTQIVGMRNVFVHEYYGVDTKLLWEIIKNDLPEFKRKVIAIIETII
ncbi:MAG: DUF86 domain-containing protein [Chitinophagaceae bacterium]|nr:DUF86 domain-containing protein [Chitinophagaceae bacterium]